MLDSLLNLISDAWWTYPFLFLFALLDSVIPLIPSETAVITAGVGAATGNLVLVLIIVVAAVGAVCGDNIAYEIGKRAQPWIDRRFSGPKAAARLAWARQLLHTRGAGLIVIARFIPGGRTAITITAGTTQMPRGRFVAATIVAGVIWATYAALLGYYGGTRFEDSPTKALLLAFAIATAVLLLTEGIRWIIGRRRRSTAPDDREQAARQ
jgi:membrane protein DedA with SNARE-associated domain